MKNLVDKLDYQINPGHVIPANCDELFERGQTESGDFFIQPSIEVSPFQVFCNFENDQIMTVIKHDKSEKRRTASQGKPGCEV